MPLFPLPTVLAHRGNHSVYPENTLAAFRAALGVKWLEFDVMLSLDQVPIIFHDDLLSPMTNGTGVVAKHSWAELQQLTVKHRLNGLPSAEAIPSLAQFLATLDDNVAFNLEIKANQGDDRVTCQRILDVLHADAHLPALLATNRILLSSFSKEAIRYCRMHAPSIPRAYLIESFEVDSIAFAQAQQCVALNFWHLMPRADTCLAQAMVANIPTLCFTVNTLSEARDWLRKGVKGVFTNNIDCYSLAI